MMTLNQRIRSCLTQFRIESLRQGVWTVSSYVGSSPSVFYTGGPLVKDIQAKLKSAGFDCVIIESKLAYMKYVRGIGQVVKLRISQ